MMSVRSGRILVAPVLVSLALAVGACGHAEESAQTTPDSPAARSESDEVSRPAPEARTNSERAFLVELTEFGLPTGMSADTTVEVGVGICQNIDDGVDTDTILDHIRPLSSAIATQSTDHDTDRVGRAIVEASRTHLCS